MDLGVDDHVIVVEHQHQRSAQVGEVVDQHRQNLFADRHHGRAQPPLGGLGERGLDRGDGGHDVAPEPQRVVVVWVQRDPGHRHRRPAAAHSASRLDLPHPVGAETTVSFASRTCASASSARGRGTICERRTGMASFERTITKGMAGGCLPRALGTYSPPPAGAVKPQPPAFQPLQGRRRRGHLAAAQQGQRLCAEIHLRNVPPDALRGNLGREPRRTRPTSHGPAETGRLGR